MLGQNERRDSEMGRTWRIVIIVSAIGCCLLMAGLAFGFSALMPNLLRIGAFHQVCPENHAGTSCQAQISRLTGMFTLTSSLLNILTLPSGAMLDYLGPRVTAGSFCCFVALGCWLFSLGSDVNYYVGFILLGVSGPYIFNCTLSFGNYFPARSGLITAILVGCFDASSGDFAVLNSLIDAGLAFSTAFRLLALLALLCAASTCAWPDRKVDEDASPEAEPSVKEPLMKQSLWNVWSSTEFWLLTYAASVSMTSINFFIATAYPQMLSVVPSESHAESLNREFSRLLPLGGILFAPLIGTVIDKVGEPLGYLILQCAYAAFTLLLVAFFAIGTGTTGDALARAGFVCFAFCRPLLYTLNPMICGRLFGQEVFGRVFGLMNTIAGFCNLMVQPLAALAHQHGFQGINVILGVLQLSTAVLPIWILCRSKPKLSNALGYGIA
ncbi:Protein FMP42 [Durusdinium trenchii]